MGGPYRKVFVDMVIDLISFLSLNKFITSFSVSLFAFCAIPQGPYRKFINVET